MHKLYIQTYYCCTECEEDIDISRCLWSETRFIVFSAHVTMHSATTRSMLMLRFPTAPTHPARALGKIQPTPAVPAEHLSTFLSHDKTTHRARNQTEDLGAPDTARLLANSIIPLGTFRILRGGQQLADAGNWTEAFILRRKLVREAYGGNCGRGGLLQAEGPRLEKGDAWRKRRHASGAGSCRHCKEHDPAETARHAPNDANRNTTLSVLL